MAPQPALPDPLRSVHTAWQELEAFLGSITSDQARRRDSQGWTVADHLVHLAVWEESVSALFRDSPRHVALGIDETFYRSASFDQINERIRQGRGPTSLAEAIAELRASHAALMAFVVALPEADFGRTVSDRFPSAPRSDDRLVLDFILENTARHFIEHLAWMRRLVGGPA